MSLSQWQRTRLAHRIATRSGNSVGASIRPDRASILAEKLSIKHLRRVNSITKKYPDYYPELPDKILNVSPDRRDAYLDHLELLISKVREMENFDGKLDHVSDIPFTVDEIIGYVLTFLEDNSSPAMNDQQKGALVSVYFLLTKNWTPKYPYPSDFPTWKDHQPQTSGKWLTELTLAHPEDPDYLYHRYIGRIDYRNHIAEIFSIGYNPIAPDKLPEIFFEYSTELIDAIRGISTVDMDDYDALREVAAAGASEMQMKEIMRFPAQINSFDNYLKMNISYPEGIRFAATLRKYEAFQQYPDLALIEPPQMQQCMAVLNVSIMCAKYASEFLRPDKTIGDTRLVNLLLEHPERAEDLLPIIKERRTASFDSLTSITNDVLGDGTL